MLMQSLVNLLRRSRLKSVTTIALIVASSFISWIPLVVYFMLVDEEFHMDNLELSHGLLVLCLVLFHINAVANPVGFIR